MIKFGAVTIDVSHPLGYAKDLKEGCRGLYTAVFNDGFRGDDEVEAFAYNNNLKICDTLDELADEVDIGVVHSCNWDKHMGYLKPFIDRNKPVFVDKPLVGNLKEARELIELNKKGAKIIGTSALRYAYDVLEAKAKAAEKDAKITHVTVSVGLDDYNYAIHAFEEICTLIDSKPVTAKYIGTAKGGCEVCDSYFITFEGGETACCHNFLNRYCSFHTTVLTDKDDADSIFDVTTGKLYAALMEQVCSYMEGKDNILAPMEELYIPMNLALACKASKLAGGKEIALSDPCLENISFDGNEFERGYAAKALAGSKMYVKEEK